MNTKQQGDIAVAQAIAYYTMCGYDVSIPMTDATRYDLIVDNRTGQISRIQVKSSNQRTASGTPCVTLSTQGGNQSWGGVIKRISEDEVDEVFVYFIEDGRRWVFPVANCAGKRSMTLGKLQDTYRV